MHLKQLDSIIDSYREKVKIELDRACRLSYNAYKEEKRISLDDNNINIGKNNNTDEIDLTKKTKELQNKDNSGADNYIKFAMPYAQDATRRYFSYLSLKTEHITKSSFDIFGLSISFLQKPNIN